MKRATMKVGLLFLTLGLLGLPLFAGGQKEASSAAQKAGASVRIGAIYPLTGGVAPIGLNIRKGIEFAVDEINGKNGINGKKIEIVWGDSTGDPKVGMAEAERLITKENVDVILGAYQSSVTNVVSEVAQRYQCPMITAISTADVITTRGYDYFFRLAPTNMLYLRDMIQYCADVSNKYNLGYKNVAILTGTDLLGQESLKWAKYWAQKQENFKIVAEVQYTINAVDLSSEVLTVKRANPDILVIDPYISDAILLTKTLQEQGCKPKIVIGKATGLIDPSFIPTVGKLANYFTTTVEWNTDIPKAVDTNAKFKAKYNINMNGHSAEVYTAVYLLRDAIASIQGQPDRKAIRDAMASLKVDGKFKDGTPIILPYEKIEFANFENAAGKHTNQNKYASVTIAQIVDGKYVTVWPFESAAAAPVVPIKW